MILWVLIGIWCLACCSGIEETALGGLLPLGAVSFCCVVGVYFVMVLVGADLCHGGLHNNGFLVERVA